MVGKVRGKQPGEFGYSRTPQTSRGTQQNQCVSCGLSDEEKAKGRRRKGRPNPRKKVVGLAQRAGNPYCEIGIADCRVDVHGRRVGVKRRAVRRRESFG